MRKWIVSACLILLVGCSHVIIDWEDFLQFHGEKYFSDAGVELSDLKFIGENIGEIKYTLKDNVKKSNYRSKDGDAAYLKTGTKLYAVINHPDLIAISDPEKINGYKLYVREGDQNILDIPTFLPEEPIKKIEIFEELENNEYIFNTMIDQKEKIQSFIELFQTSQSDTSLEYRDDDPKSKSYAIILYSSSPMASKHSIYFDGGKYFWLNKEYEILSDRINEFLTPANEEKV
ncbi:DUF5301 domain-containing protein [Bacillus niameyensis]|uniref:DUF5301 domain-containing protein n=1 Tax=Bacillus niameyensis TaxID=1522308 RepID=UPI000783A27C|nr:DUF5301 domain-containing protein [Bacillus niameyensis]